MTWLSSSRLLFAASLLAGVLGTNAAHGQPLAYRDADGRWRWTNVSVTSRLNAKSTAGTETMGVFEVTFRDVTEATGVGFDDPDAGPARRATMRAVLQYLSAILDVPGTADLVVFESDTEGRGALAAAGPLLSPTVGFQGGLVFDHLTTGNDPRSDAPDGTVAVDFGFTWNSDRDAPGAAEFDLYSGLLHEVVHALGFFSAVGEDSQSELFNDDGEGLFSLLDSFLFRASDDRFLFLPGGEVNSEPDDVLSSDLFFNAPLTSSSFGEAPAVFAPSTFFEGSSIAHWDPAVGPEAVMLPVLSRGNERRELTPWEIQMLGDLGYALAPCVDPEEGAAGCEIEVPDDPGVAPSGPNGVTADPPGVSGSPGVAGVDDRGCQASPHGAPVGPVALGLLMLLGIRWRRRPTVE